MRKLDRRLKSRLLCTALAAVLVFDLLYAVITVSGPTNLSEEYAYAGLALNAIHGQVNLQQIDASRLLQYLPIAAFYEAFGVGIYTSSAWNMVCFLGTVLVAFLIGRELYGPITGLTSALLASFFTPIVKVSSTLDIVMSMAFFISLVMLALLYGRNRGSKAWMFAAGVFVVAAQLTIPIALIAAAALALYLVLELARKKIELKLVLYVLAGAAVAAAVVLAFSYSVSGNPISIATLNGAYYSNLTMTDTAYGIIGAPIVYANGSKNDLFGWYMHYYPGQMFEYSAMQAIVGGILHGNITLWSVWQQLYSQAMIAGFYFYAALAAAIYLTIRWDRRLYYPLMWLAVGFLFLQFAPQGGTLSPFRYILIFRDVRYLTALAVPTSVLIAVALSRFVSGKGHGAKGLTKRKIRISLAIAAVAFLIITSIPANIEWHSYIYTEYYSLHALAGIIQHTGGITTVYYPSVDWPDMIVYLHDSSQLNLQMLDGISNCTYFAAGSYVVLPNVTKGYAPQWPYINDTSAYCPDMHLVAEPVVQPPYGTAGFNQMYIALKNQQRLYYVVP